MALFKILKGPEAGLSNVPFHEGYAYFTDQGNLLIDIIVGDEEIRLQTNAKYASALKAADGTIINIDDLVLASDVIDIAHGGTGANTATGARAALDVYSTDEVDDGIGEVETIAKSFSIGPSEWIADGSKFSKTISYPEMSCGKSGTVPPIITPTSNTEEYSKIESATADVVTKTIKLIIPEKPNNTIDFIVVDNR